MSDPGWTVEVFGDARGNPGLAGIGVVVRDGGGRERDRTARFLGATTRMRARYQAIVAGLRAAVEANVDAAILTSDEVAVKQIGGRSRAQAVEVVDLLAEALRLLEANPGLSISLADEGTLDTAENLATVAIDTRGRRTAFD